MGRRQRRKVVDVASKQKSKKTIIQALQYQAGGLLYFTAAWVIITFGTPHIGLWWANIVGNLVGITLNYMVQRFWAFAGGVDVFNSGWRFVVLTALNLVLSYFILNQLVGWGVKLWLAQFFSAALFTIWNWLWYKYWVFREVERGK